MILTAYARPWPTWPSIEIQCALGWTKLPQGTMWLEWLTGSPALKHRQVGKRSPMSSKRWAERLNRLRNMSLAEVRERTKQELHKRIDLARFHLNSVQPTAIIEENVGRGRFFFYQEQVPELVTLLRQKVPAQ